jgi:hypothetical protein
MLLFPVYKGDTEVEGVKSLAQATDLGNDWRDWSSGYCDSKAQSILFYYM